jgi:hypothetical protein
MYDDVACTTNLHVGPHNKIVFSISQDVAKIMSSLHQHSGSQVIVKTSAWKDNKQVDSMMPTVRDVHQYSSAAFGNTVFQIGTPPKREDPDRLVASSLFQFNFGGKSSLPNVVQAGDPVLHERTAEVPLQV